MKHLWLKNTALAERRRIRIEVRRLLLGLGPTSSEIADALEHEGVLGIPRDPFECALARFLKAIVPAHPGIEEIAIGRSRRRGDFMLLIRQGRMPRWTINVALSQPILLFLSDFDRFRYCNLIDASLCPAFKSLASREGVSRTGSDHLLRSRRTDGLVSVGTAKALIPQFARQGD
jgi:hypothetical protein